MPALLLQLELAASVATADREREGASFLSLPLRASPLCVDRQLYRVRYAIFVRVYVYARRSLAIC